MKESVVLMVGLVGKLALGGLAPGQCLKFALLFLTFIQSSRILSDYSHYMYVYVCNPFLRDFLHIQTTYASTFSLISRTFITTYL